MRSQPTNRPSRRGFLGASAAGFSTLALADRTRPAKAAQAAGERSPSEDTFSAAELRQLRKELRTELFDRVLPFWERHGIDHELGGFMCSVDYDGSVIHTNKYHWYQGRGLWVYSYLFNHFGGDAGHLEVARKTRDFLLRHAVGDDGWWAETLARDGRVIKPFSGDVYGMFCGAEGLQEFAWAAGDDTAREQARQLLVRLFTLVSRPNYQDVYAPRQGYRVLGIWMYLLQACTQYLQRWPDQDLEHYAEVSVDAIIKKHFNPELGLTNEYLAFDFSRPPEIANLCLVGHCVQAFWMVMDEALRRQDLDLLETCIQRTRRHLDVGWDHVFGGLCEWVNVDQRQHEWGPQRFGDVIVDLQMVGEYNYLKSFWSLNEVMLTTMLVYQLRQCGWAARYFRLARDVVDEKFSRHHHNQLTYMLATNRRMNLVPDGTRQDNYHPLRRLMRNLRSIDELL